MENLKKKALMKYELEDLYISEKSQAYKLIYKGKLKLKFLKWLETINHSNTEIEFKTPEVLSHWGSYAWQSAIIEFGDEIRGEGFIVEITGQVNHWKIKISLYDKEKNKESLKNFRKKMNNKA